MLAGARIVAHQAGHAVSAIERFMQNALADHTVEPMSMIFFMKRSFTLALVAFQHIRFWECRIGITARA